MFYYFCRVLKTLGATPAMAAGIVDRVMHMKDVVGLIRQKCLHFVSLKKQAAKLRHYRVFAAYRLQAQGLYTALCTALYTEPYPGFYSPTLTTCTANAPASPRSHQPVFHSPSTGLSAGRTRHCEKRLVRRSSTSEGGSDEAIQLSIRGAKSGLLRGACHRARIRATRWLAMTVTELAV